MDIILLLYWPNKPPSITDTLLVESSLVRLTVSVVGKVLAQWCGHANHGSTRQLC